MPSDPQEVLRQLALGDERLLHKLVGEPVPTGKAAAVLEDSLDRRTRTLVYLAALIALGAPTDSLRWAAERATTSGASLETVAGVLLASAPVMGRAGLVEAAPRLALALGLDL